MSFISHAQNFEDVMLWRALRHIEAGFYIDIGAWSPDFDSVTRAFYERGWRGINVEPNPEFLLQLNERRPRDINLGCAVSDHDGHGRIAILDTSGLSTLDETISRAHEQSGYSAEEYRDVDLITLKQVCERHLPASQPVHFLKVDVEGLERQVLQGNDWESWRPWLVVVEATRPMSQVESYTEWEPVLDEADYCFCYADGLNRFYVAAEHAELAAALRFPPNVFDDFITQSRWIAEGTAEGARERIDQLSAELQESQTHAQWLESMRTEDQRKIDELSGQVYHWWSFADKAASELDALYRSKSWRVTRPLRTTMLLVKYLTRLPGRVLRWLMRLPKAGTRRLLSRAVAFVLRHERLKLKALQWVRRHPRLKERFRKFAQNMGLIESPAQYAGIEHSDPTRGGSYGRRGTHESTMELTPRAQAIYRGLKSRMADKDKVAN